MLRRFQRSGLAVAGGMLLSACSETNDGNLTAPPPPFVPSTEVASGGSSGNPPVSVIPEGGRDSDEDGPAHLERPWKSTGCGTPPPAEQVPTIPGSRTGYTEFFVTQTGATLAQDDPNNAGDRQFFVRLPPDYDYTKPYRVVYVGQGCGAYRAAKNNTDPYYNEKQGGSEQAIYVAVSVPDNDANPTCYDNNNGEQSQEWEAFELMHTFVEKTYCADNNRIFVAGYSTGGWLANMWSCYFGGAPRPERKFSPKWAVRGGARMTGSLPPNQPKPCTGPAAGIWVHDAGDKANLLATNVAALNLSLETNGCSGDYENGPKRPWAPAENIAGLKGGICQEYTGCPADVAKNYPLVFCTTNGLGHADQPATIPAFTRFFESMDPEP